MGLEHSRRRCKPLERDQSSCKRGGNREQAVEKEEQPVRKGLEHLPKRSTVVERGKSM